MNSRRPLLSATCILATATILAWASLASNFLQRPIAAQPADSGENKSYDLVIYGGTSGGVAAAIQAARMGRSVVLVEPGQHLGGLTSGGLGATDIGNKQAIGGISREFYRRVHDHYADDDAWTFQRHEDYRSGRQSADEQTMWTFEPHVAEAIFDRWVEEAGIEVLRGERLGRTGGVRKNGARIESIRTESGRVLNGRMFIDATYEGDLLAAAEVAYFVGREGNDRYGETLNGVQTENAVHHQFIRRVDPYLTPGDPSSGLLPGINPRGPGEEGAEDHRVQAYNFRMCQTNVPENRRPWPKPDDYDPVRYELLLRNFDAGDDRLPLSVTHMPNGKTDTNNNFAVSTDYIGASYEWPEADYATRERLFEEHKSYQLGLMWTLAHSPRVPQEIRDYVNTWALSKDEFTGSDNWPHQLYVREARRMISDYVMTQHHCQRREVAEDSVGLAAYTMDSHHVQRYVTDGRVLNEGDVQVGGFAPYPISYRSIVPKRAECTNLLVPVCLSASHIAYGSIRMEPVFMVLGQSAATAASLAIEANVDVQQVAYAALQARLLEDEQMLEWTGPRPNQGLDPAVLSGIVIDDTQAELTGPWQASRSVSGFVGRHYLHDGDQSKGELTARFPLRVKSPGQYQVRLVFTAHDNRATNVPVRVFDGRRTESVEVNQRQRPDEEDGMLTLGRFELSPESDGWVEISSAGTRGHVIVDAVQLLPVER
ncbi:MAG: FAD-dependent oxidoreductase [Pirellulales bacterium]